MKKNLLKKGLFYSNGKSGRFYSVRKILDEGEFKLYDGQSDTDCIRYKTVIGENRDTFGKCTKNSMSLWAKNVVEPFKIELNDTLYQTIVDKLLSFSNHSEALEYLLSEEKLKNKKQITTLLKLLNIYYSPSFNTKRLRDLLISVTVDLKIEGLIII